MTEEGDHSARDVELVLGLFRRLFAEAYVDTEGLPGRRRFLVDGSIYDVTEEEIAALDRVIPPPDDAAGVTRE